MPNNQSLPTRKNKLLRLLKYAKDGTLYSRVCRWRLEQQQLHRQNQWHKRVATREMVLYKLEAGAQIILYRDDCLSKDIFVEHFEANERTFVCRYLRAGDIFVDVGANIGLFTVIGAKIVGSTGKVYAFEPSAVTYGRLTQNVRLNRLRNVECLQLALSDQDETRTMTTAPDGFAAWNSLAHPSAGSRFVPEEIQCRKWDTFAAQTSLMGKVVLIKIDIEGWEFYMLNGAQATLIQPDAPDLLVEFTEVNTKAAGVTGVEVYELLITFGYQLYRIDSTRKTMRPAIAQSYEWENLLATKDIAQVCKRTGYKYEPI